MIKKCLLTRKTSDAQELVWKNYMLRSTETKNNGLSCAHFLTWLADLVQSEIGLAKSVKPISNEQQRPATPRSESFLAGCI